MIFKIKEFSLFIFLILLQSCSMGRIGNFLESSFDDLGSEDSLEKLGSLIEKKQENDKTNAKEIKNEEKSKIDVLEKQVISLKQQKNKNKEIKTKKVNTSQKKIKNEEKSKIDVLEKQVISLKQQKNKNKEIKTKKVNTSQKKIKNGLQSYKIIFILKDVDPKDPIEKLSSILSDSEVNFEIEKIERFFDSKNKNTQSN